MVFVCIILIMTIFTKKREDTPMLILILGLALIIPISTNVLVVLKRKDIIEIEVDVKYP